MKFWGYQRPDGRVGVRNHVAVIPSTYCAVRVARWIAERVQGAVALHHSVGCSQVGLDLEMTARTLKNLGRHPNVAAVLVVGLGCERLTPAELAEGIAESGKSVEMITIQDCGGSLKALEAGASIARKLVQHAATLKKEQFGLEHLAVATECGGTDGLSGLLANPAVGIAADMLVAEGGTAMISEINELLGTEHLMAARAASSEVADRIRKVVALSEARLAWQSENDRTGKRLALISTGNFDGGVSTVVEKALGGYKKSGASPFVDVLRYSDLPSKRGLHLMDTSGNDAESTTGMVAGGCQVVLFTTGRGTPDGPSHRPGDSRSPATLRATRRCSTTST